MDWTIFIIVIGVALIDGKLWVMVKAQRDHNKKVEELLGKIAGEKPLSQSGK